ncbi:hypothetical protein Q4489_09620 [Thalassotalea sp. 1_MG-2023]|uniref:hypothetical protein n=1 Tax=Thalassotalea sp. 1_MG-2023 TaxID=3062680 RepID=UPI0026E3BF8F|nr:hypothetical protein [Thalassotalea sp. 1_MG-2023]MDO6427271.1 hypothetical protein [Thalassotalea sp. 1_MG-2023]
MSEALPITITAADEAKKSLPAIISVINKLEAQLNFITLTAGWFADPEHELAITFAINCLPFFPEQQFPVSDEFIALADDVHFAYHDEHRKYQCYVQLTDTEIALAKQKKSILAAILDKKLTIVLNEIALKQRLSVI